MVVRTPMRHHNGSRLIHATIYFQINFEEKRVIPIYIIDYIICIVYVVQFFFVFCYQELPILGTQIEFTE